MRIVEERAKLRDIFKEEMTGLERLGIGLKEMEAAVGLLA